LLQTLRRSAVSELSCATLDIHTPDLERALQALAPHVVVHTCGPFQGQQYHVAAACIAAGAHYIDLADGREFVAGIGCLQKQALAAGLAVISGASSVPALSSTVADHQPGQPHGPGAVDDSSHPELLRQALAREGPRPGLRVER
jgi:short subunit dehydrogenase-like uncharacterized protein